MRLASLFNEYNAFWKWDSKTMHTTKSIVGVGGRYMCGVCDHFKRVHPSVELVGLGSGRVGQPGKWCAGVKSEGRATQHNICVKAVVPILEPFRLYVVQLQADTYADAFD